MGGVIREGCFPQSTRSLGKLSKHDQPWLQKNFGEFLVGNNFHHICVVKKC